MSYNELHRANPVARFFRDMYDALIGDKKRHQAYLTRLQRVRELSAGVDRTNISQLNELVDRTEKELEITEVSTDFFPNMGSPRSEYYEIESPAAFETAKASTSRAFERLKPLDPDRFKE